MTTLVQRHPNTLVIGTGLPLLIISFVLIYWLKYGDLFLSPRAFGLLSLLGGSWLLVNLLLNLPQRLVNATLAAGMALLGKSTLALLFILSLLIQLLAWSDLSRLLVYGPGLIFAGGLMATYALFRALVPVQSRGDQRDKKSHWLTLSPQLLVLDALLLAISYGGTVYFMQHALSFKTQTTDIMVLLSGFWLASALVTGKFNRVNFNNYLEALIPALKAVAFLSGGLAMALYILRFAGYSWVQLSASLGLYLAGEILLFGLYVTYRKLNVEPKDIDDVVEISRFFKSSQREIPFSPRPDVIRQPATDKARQAIEHDYPRDFRFLSQALDLTKIEADRCAILDTDVLFNLGVLEQGRNQLLVNLHKLNDVRWINRYFLTAHTRLEAGGYLVGHAQTIATRRGYYAYRYPRPFDSIFYSLNFLWHRACPKLPWIQKFYFAVTKGRNRLISRAEILGRLYFCGFKVLAEEEIGHRFYFVAQKVKEPSFDENPTYGPLIKLRRFGQGGRPLEVLKFRTMFPYSEYLQEYVYEHQQLDRGGKFNNDFRVTGWGRFMRRTWLDELPMFWNWVKGEMQLLGVRPLSAQYLGLYRDDIKDLRAQVKPGLLPPFYADMPKSLDEIMASEERYIKAYLKNPLLTQCRYFWKCFVNIVFKGKRSQ